MGLAFSRLWERMFGKKEMRILMVREDAILDPQDETCCALRTLLCTTREGSLFLPRGPFVQRCVKTCK